MTTLTKQTLNVGDVIEFQPRQGKTRIVKITALHPGGFDAHMVGSKQRTFGFYKQIVRVHRAMDTDEIEHTFTVVGQDETFYAWSCSCGHSEVGMGLHAKAAEDSAFIQQEAHLDATEGASDEDVA